MTAIAGSEEFSKSGAAGRATGGGAAAGEITRYKHLVKEGAHDTKGLLLADCASLVLECLRPASCSKVLRVDKSASSLKDLKRVTAMNKILSLLPGMRDEAEKSLHMKDLRRQIKNGEGVGHARLELMQKLAAQLFPENEEHRIQFVRELTNATLEPPTMRAYLLLNGPSLPRHRVDFIRDGLLMICNLVDARHISIGAAVKQLEHIFFEKLIRNYIDADIVMSLGKECSDRLGFPFLDRELSEQCDTLLTEYERHHDEVYSSMNRCVYVYYEDACKLASGIQQARNECFSKISTLYLPYIRNKEEKTRIEKRMANQWYSVETIRIEARRRPSKWRP